MKKNKKKRSIQSKIRHIMIYTFLLICVVTLPYELYQSKKSEKEARENFEQARIKSQIYLEERAKQEEQERLEQEELARQEQEKFEAMKNSLPSKFNMRNKIKITAENQGQKPFCSIYAYVKSLEITLNYQGNYNYDFKKVYKYLKTAPNDLKDREDISINSILKDLIGLDNCTHKDWDFDSEDLTLIKNEIVNGRPMLIDINDKMSIDIGGDPSMLGTEYGSGHEMIIIGYDDTKQSWLCLNSWGADWGKNGNGTLWIRYDNENIVYPYKHMFQAIIKE